jgi:hypothetical protein
MFDQELPDILRTGVLVCRTERKTFLLQLNQTKDRRECEFSTNMLRLRWTCADASVSFALANLFSPSDGIGWSMSACELSSRQAFI